MNVLQQGIVASIAFLSACQSEFIFHDDFDADAVGKPPSSSPAGDPDGDQLVTGLPARAKVINAAPLAWGPWFFAARGCQAMRLERGWSATAAMVDCIPVGSPITEGTVWIWYLAMSETVASIPELSVEILASGGDVLGRLVLTGGSFRVEGATSGTLDWQYAKDQAHLCLFTVQLDKREFSVFASTQGASDSFGPVSFQSAGAVDFERLRFSYPPAVTEALPGAYVIDDLTMTLKEPDLPTDGCALYEDVILPTAATGHVDAEGAAINSGGLVVGNALQDNGAPMPVYWPRNGDGSYALFKKLLLPATTPTNTPQGEALGVNDHGDIVGWGDRGGDYAVWWSAASGYALEVIDDMRYRATDINNGRWITGRGTGEAQLAQADQNQATPTTAKQLPDIGHCSEFEQTGANAVNDAYGIVGFAGDCELATGPNKKGKTATWWHDGSTEGLGKPAGIYEAEALDINEANEIVGVGRQQDGTTHPVFWPGGGGSATDLPGPDGQRVIGSATAINNAGTIVGSVTLDGVLHAAMWGQCQGAPLHLHLLADRVVLDDGVELVEAVDVNEEGKILTNAHSPVGDHPVVLLPEAP